MTSIKHSYSNSVKPKTNFYFGPYGIKGMTYEKYRQNNIKDKPKSDNISKPTFVPWTPSRVKYELKMPNIFHHQDYVYTRDSDDNEYSLDINIGENFSQKVFDLDIDFEVITKENDEHIYLIADFYEKPFDFVDDYQIVNISRKIEAILIGIDDAIKRGLYDQIIFKQQEEEYEEDDYCQHQYDEYEEELYQDSLDEEYYSDDE